MPKELKLTRGYTAIVDDEDYEWLSKWKWTALPTAHRVYARRAYWDGDKYKTVYLHRQIMNATGKITVDHINRDGLDCRRANMRLATNSQNCFNTGMRRNNTSGIRGVSWWKAMRAWRADIRIMGRHIHLGKFLTIRAAESAYRAAAEQFQGEFAAHLSEKSET